MLDNRWALMLAAHYRIIRLQHLRLPFWNHGLFTVECYNYLLYEYLLCRATNIDKWDSISPFALDF